MMDDRRNNTVIAKGHAATIGSSDSIVLRLTLATLGGSVPATRKTNDSR